MKKLFKFYLIAISITAFYIFDKWLRSHPAGTIIVLNGPSGSGKSSIQKEFQYLMMPQLWCKLGIDNLFDQPMPDITLENIAYWQSPNPIRWVTSETDSENHPIITLHTAEQADHVAYAMNTAIADYAANNCNVIVDYIAYKKRWLNDLLAKISGFKTIWVAVDIDLDTLEQRERARGTSPQGHARSHYDYVYHDFVYDLRVNSGKNNAHEIAKQIADYIKNQE